MVGLAPIIGAVVLGLMGFVGYLFFGAYMKAPDKGKAKKVTEDELLAKKRADAKLQKEKNHKKMDKVKPLVPAKNKSSSSTNHKDHPLFWKEIGGHTAGASCVAFSARHNLVASCSVDGTVRCMPFSDVGAASAHDVYASFEGIPTAVAFTQNAKRVVVAVGGILKYYSIAIGSEAKKIDHVKDLSSGLKTVSSIQLLDVEHWMTVVACGTDEAGEPCIRAFDQKGHRICNLVQVKRKGRADKHRPPLPKNALAVASPDDR